MNIPGGMKAPSRPKRRLIPLTSHGWRCLVQLPLTLLGLAALTVLFLR
jgi:hypothetical protein